MPKNYLLVYSEQLATDIENRLDDELSVETVLEDNKQVLTLAKKHKVNYLLIDDKYEINI